MHDAVKGTKTYSLGDHLVLHDSNAEKLHLLNPMARSIWQACAQGFQLSEIADTLSELHRLPMDSALLTVRSTIEAWRGSGPAEATHAATDTARVAHPPPVRMTRYYGFYDRAVRVNYSATKLESLIHPVFENMTIPLVTRPDNVFDVYQEQKAFILSRDLQEISRTDSRENVALDAIREITRVSYQSPACLTVLHAGAVAFSDQAILIAGKGGSGKTTLAAALIKNGFVHISDDVAPILNANHEVFPVPVALCVKQGSWQALQTWYPKLTHQRAYQRLGKRVRYLSPGSSVARAPYRSYPVSHILFPRYQPGTSASLTPLSAAGILQRLIDAGSVLGGGFDSVKVKSFLTWIESLRGYALDYDDLPDALALIQRMDGMAPPRS